MTKDELIRALEPFTDELEIMIGHAGRWYEVDNHEYAQRFGGEGCLVLNLGAQILLRTRPRMETGACRMFIPLWPDYTTKCANCGQPAAAHSAQNRGESL